MPKSSGRELVIKKGSVVIAAIRNKTFSWNGEPIDVTSDDDDGFRTLLASAIGQEQIDISGDGVTDADVLKDIALEPATTKMLTDITIAWVDSTAIIAGDFQLISYEETGPYQDARTFNFAMQSSGLWVYTP